MAETGPAHVTGPGIRVAAYAGAQPYRDEGPVGDRGEERYHCIRGQCRHYRGARRYSRDTSTLVGVDAGMKSYFYARDLSF